MILQALVDYYEELLKEGKTVPNGWCRAKVAFALNLTEDGSLKNVISLKEEQEMGKKTIWISSERTVPQMVSRSSGVSANFLCDNSKYILGTDTEGSGGRVQECFEAGKQRHLEILKDVHSAAAESVKNFFQTWKPEEAKENPKLQELWDEITDGSNLIFLIDGKECQDDEAIQNAWNQQILEGGAETEGVCLVTGKRADIARIHTAIKGVQGAQSSGAALVSFNAPAFESYGKTQNYNAPVGKYAAFAYTTALNYLLSQKAHSSQKKYAMQLGDATVVFWAEGGEELYQDVFGWGMEMPVDNQKEIQGILKLAAKGEPVPVGNLELDLNRKFYILGLAPNAARLSVRFFLSGSFWQLAGTYQCPLYAFADGEASLGKSGVSGDLGILAGDHKSKCKREKTSCQYGGGSRSGNYCRRPLSHKPVYRSFDSDSGRTRENDLGKSFYYKSVSDAELWLEGRGRICESE